jgi:hypothetical protein
MLLVSVLLSIQYLGLHRGVELEITAIPLPSFTLRSK